MTARLTTSAALTCRRSGVSMAGHHRLKTCHHHRLRKPVVFNYLKCAPTQPCAKCMNCKRRAPVAPVNVKNSKSKACIYMPISLQKNATPKTTRTP